MIVITTTIKDKGFVAHHLLPTARELIMKCYSKEECKQVDAYLGIDSRAALRLSLDLLEVQVTPTEYLISLRDTLGLGDRARQVAQVA